MTMDIRIVKAGEFGDASCRALLECMAGYASPVVGLATGKTPTALYETLREAVVEGRASVAEVRPFAIDEYGGPRDHPCANRAFFARYWDVIPGAAPVEQFNPEARGSGELRRFRGALAAAGGLDVVVLGIGLNGHLAFNEPLTSPFVAAHVAVLAQQTLDAALPCWGKDVPQWGMTIWLAEILGSGRALLLANGTAKAAIVARALRGDVDAECPASFLRGHGALTVVLDEAAGALTLPSPVATGEGS